MTPRLTRDVLRQPPWSYALAAVAPVTAMLMLQAAGVFVDRLPSAPLLAAILAVAWYCGRLPALLATIVSIVLHAYVLIRSPRHETDAGDVVGLILFAGLAVFVSYAAPRLGQTLRELEHERKREQIARTEAERHGREADELRRLSRALTHTASPTAAAQRVADAVKRFFEPSSAVVRLLEPDGAMVAFAIAGENPVVTPGHRMPAGSGVVGQAVTQRRLVMTNSVLSDPRIDLPSQVRDQHERLGHQLVIAAPLIVDDVVIGTLALNDTTTRTFVETELALFQALANHAAVGIRNAQRFQQERTARQEAEASSRTKDEFLAMLGHELRNPLAAIGSAIAVLNRLGGGDERSMHSREVITRQVAHLRELMDDLLDVGRVMTGKIILSPKTVDLSEVACRGWAVLESTGTFAQHKARLETEPVWVNADETRMAQVIDNLITNAVKYTPVGGSVMMAVLCEGDDAVIRVADTGIGISPALLPRIFDLFVQGELTRDRAKGGLGIGLTLVKRLVEMHGGSVGACSEGPGRGSAFTVRLPRLAVPAETVATGPTRTGARGGRRVLLVEDSADVRRMLRLRLELDSHEVHEAEDGITGLAEAFRLQPDVAVIDIGLPGLDGWELARQLRATEAGRRMILVAISGYGQLEDQQLSREAGFDAHLVKPVDLDALTEAIYGVSLISEEEYQVKRRQILDRM
jgi:signal transduction histidine kinase/ActR/RegA family two-component response regulator